MKELSSALTQARGLIEQRFVKYYKQKLNSMCGERTQVLDLGIDWDSVEKLVNMNIDQGENAIQTLQQTVLWEGLKKGIMRYIAEDAVQRDLFNDAVSSIVIELTSDSDTDVNFIRGMGLLVYQFNVNNITILKPAQIYKSMKMSFDSMVENMYEEESDEEHVDIADDDEAHKKGTDADNIHSNSDESDNEDEDLITGKPIDDLRRAALLPAVEERQNLSYLYRLLASTNPYWKPAGDIQKELISISNAEVKKRIDAQKNSDEKFIKTWVVNKLNKNGMKQERVLVLTNAKYYTCKIVQDKVEKKITLDPKHVKAYSLDKVIMIDVARFKPSTTDKKLQPFGMAIYIEKDEKDKKESSPKLNRVSSAYTSSPVSETEIDKPLFKSTSFSRDSNASDTSDLTEDYEEEEIVVEEIGGDGVPKKKKKKKKAVKILGKITKHAKKGVNKVFSPSDEPLDSQNEDDLQQRPNTDNLRAQYVLAPGDIFQSDNQQVFLLEIAWCIFTAAAAYQGLKKNLKVLRPFQNYRLNKPSANVGAMIYNKLNMGSSLK